MYFKMNFIPVVQSWIFSIITLVFSVSDLVLSYYQYLQWILLLAILQTVFAA